MATKRIDQLTALLSPIAADIMPVVSSVDGKTYKLTIAQILSLGLSGELGFFIRFGAIAADTGGAEINFTSVFGAPFSNANYAFIPFGQKDGGNVEVELGVTDDNTKTANIMTVYPAADGTTVYFLAIGV